MIRRVSCATLEANRPSCESCFRARGRDRRPRGDADPHRSGLQDHEGLIGDALIFQTRRARQSDSFVMSPLNRKPRFVLMNREDVGMICPAR